MNERKKEANKEDGEKEVENVKGQNGKEESMTDNNKNQLNIEEFS